MKRGIEYEQTLLSGETIYKIWLEFQAIAKGAEQPDNPPTESPRISVAEVDFGAESWTFDTIDEFVDALREPYHKAEITFRHPSIELWLIMRGSLFT